MIAQITLRRMSDGEIVIFPNKWEEEHGPWEPHDAVWQWTEGNYACDCNRHLFFERALGREESEEFWEEAECGDGVRYQLLGITVDGESCYSYLEET